MATFPEFVAAYRHQLANRDEIEHDLTTAIARVFAREHAAAAHRLNTMLEHWTNELPVALVAAGPALVRTPKIQSSEVLSEDFEDQLDEEVRPQLNKWAALLGAALVGAALFGTAQALNSRAETLVDGLVNRLQSMTDTASARIDQILLDGYIAGDPFDTTAQKVSDVLARLAGAPAELTARIETAALLAGIATISARLDQIVVTRMWITERDELVRETHRDADGQPQDLYTPFEVGDDLLDFPGDPNGSAAEVINCRCHLVFLNAAGAEISTE